jgi:hypothetical protein
MRFLLGSTDYHTDWIRSFELLAQEWAQHQS